MHHKFRLIGKKKNKRSGRRKSWSEKVWSKVDKRGPDECWPWIGCKKEGYGYINLRVGLRSKGKQKKIAAHRSVYELIKGKIPHGMLVRHSCHNPSCCNPSHLLVGTDADNARDKCLAGRSLQGERNPRAKLTKNKVLTIRKLRTRGWTLKRIAQRYDVNIATVGYICSRRIWSHV